MSAITTKSGIRTPATRTPSLAQLIRESQADQQVIRRASREALSAWFRQSERLNIARKDHGLRGARFVDFARRIGVDRSSAYLLVHLHRWRTDIESQCLDMAERAAKRGEPFRFPGWEAALGWFHKGRGKTGFHLLGQRNQGADDKLTPPHIFRKYGAECTLDVAASAEHHLCDVYYTKRQNALVIDWPEGHVVWMNPPYSKIDPWCEKAVAYAESGGRVIALLPGWTDSHWFQTWAALGRVTFIRNRLAFGPAYNHAPFPSIIVEWSEGTIRRYRETGKLDMRMDDRSKSA